MKPETGTVAEYVRALNNPAGLGRRSSNTDDFPPNREQ